MTPLSDNLRCTMYYMNGTDNATSNDDRCPSISSPAQHGVNDPIMFSPMACTETTVRPYFLHKDATVCKGTVGDSRFSITPGTDIEQVRSWSVWVYPLVDTNVVWFDHFFFSPGIRASWQNCGTDLMRNAFIIIGSQNILGRCGGVLPDQWQFLGFTWKGDGDDPTPPMKAFTSLSLTANSLLDTGGLFPATAYNPQPLLVTQMAAVFNVQVFNGYAVDYAVFDTVLTDLEMCALCRGGPGAGHRGQGLLRRNRDAYDLCNQCTLPSGVTHVGAARRQN